MVVMVMKIGCTCKPIGINTATNVISFKNHGFEHGENIVYSNTVGLGSTMPVSMIINNLY